MELQRLAHEFSICRVLSLDEINTDADFCFTAKTDEEISVVCPIENIPVHTAARDDGWRAFRIEGVLDFSLIGILAKISSILADNNIGIFAVSTYNTDYIFTKRESFDKACRLLADAGYTII